VNGTVLKEKAEEIGLRLNTSIEFHASNGWLDQFKNGTGIVFRTLSGELWNIDPIEVDAWKTTIHHEI
jgi:hypothetical protein